MPTSSTLIRRDKVFISENMNKVSLIKAMRKHGLTATKTIKPIVEALSATKISIHGKDSEAFAEVEPDHATRLRAAQLAIDLLGLKNDKAKDADDGKQTSKLLTDAFDKADTIKMQQIVFDKDSHSVANKQV